MANNTILRDIILAVLLFSGFIFGGIFIVSDFYNENNLVLDEDLNNTEFQTFNTEARSLSTNLTKGVNDPPSGGLESITDFFAPAIRFVNLFLKPAKIFLYFINYISGFAGFNLIPDELYDIAATILTIILIMAVVTLWLRFKT